MKFAIPSLKKLKRDDWQFVLQTFTPVLLGAMLVSMGQCSQTASPEIAPVATAPKTAEPIPVVLRWPRSYSVGGLSSNSPVIPGTPLGQRAEAVKLDRPFTGYELWVILGDGKKERADNHPYCYQDIPIIEYHWELKTEDDGEGPPTTVLGYRDRCGPRQYYSWDDCMSDAFTVGGEWLFNPNHGRGYYDDRDRWHHYDRARFECRAVTLDEYPVNDIERRDARALAAARRARVVQ
jgi:hypothetical protein